MSRVVLLEMNEVSIPFVERYTAKGLLPAFREMIDRYGYVQTESETVYERLEPWIQWVTLHSGKTYSEHGIFRLGDAVNSGVRQIYEELECKGVRVGALSPMNTVNRLKSPAFFFPDPWTGGVVSGPRDLTRLYKAIAQAVNDNADHKVTPASLTWLLEGFITYFRLSNLPIYWSFLRRSGTRPWTRALFLDCLLSDVFIKLWTKTKPDFASLFLNGTAHIQHHYFFNSSVYSGKQKNPEWYVRSGVDPLLDAYTLYDSILDSIRSIAPDARIIVATGLSQEPYDRPIYYYRLRDHASFLRAVNIRFHRVLPRMSRDFLIEFETDDDAVTAERILSTARTDDGKVIFEVENRGRSIFVTLIYPFAISRGMRIVISGIELSEFDKHVAFVAIKNGHHLGTGYVIDTGLPQKKPASTVPLVSIFDRLLSAFPG